MKFETEAGAAIFALIQSICYHPNDLKASEKVSNGRVEIEFHPHMGDIPILIGREGRQYKAIRYLAESIGRLHHQDVSIEIEESYVGKQERREFVEDPKFSVEPLLDVLLHVARAALGFVPKYEVIANPEKVTVALDLPVAHNGIVVALADAFYPYGYRHGRKVRIRNANYRAALEYSPARSA